MELFHELRMAWHFLRRERHRNKCNKIAQDSPRSHHCLMTTNADYYVSFKKYQESKVIIEPFLKDFHSA